MNSPLVSVVAPVYNEAAILPELYKRVKSSLEAFQENWELILVDDGSQDGSRELILGLANQDSKVRPGIFARKFGHLFAG